MIAAGYRGHGRVFSGGKQSGPTEAEVKELRAKIGSMAMLKEIDRVFTKYPLFGSRQIAAYLRRESTVVGRHRVRRLMAKMGLEAIYKRPQTSQPHPQHPAFPYLLRKMQIVRPNQIWCADITFVPFKICFLYLVAIMDWTTRKVLSWRLSNTMHADFCVDALNEAIAKHGPPEIGVPPVSWTVMGLEIPAFSDGPFVFDW